MDTTSEFARDNDASNLAFAPESNDGFTPEEGDRTDDQPFEPMPERLDEPIRRMLILLAAAGESLDPVEVRLALAFLLAWGAVVRHGYLFRLQTDGTSSLEAWAQGLVAGRPPLDSQAVGAPGRERSDHIN